MDKAVESEENLSTGLLYLMSISAGLVVANIYYNQPLLHLISIEFGVSQSDVSIVALSTQIGYALGLLFIIPLGDKFSSYKIMPYDFLIILGSLLGAGLANSLWVLVFCSFFIGFSSSIPQLFVPLAARLSSDENRGKAIGIVMSGLLIGILASRVISGFVGEHFGWRSMFYVATVMMVVLFFLLRWKLPKVDPTYKGSYISLLKSIFNYFKIYPELRLASLRGALSFASLSIFWTTLVFLMEDNFGYGSEITGFFGLFGIAGALGAAYIGKLNDRMNRNKIILFAIGLCFLSWIIFLFSGHFIIGIIIGVILIDLGQQSLHITNQNIIFSKYPEARNRINTVYMVSFFLGGSLGTFLGSYAWKYYQWTGVSVLGLVLALIIMVVHLVFSKKK